MDQEPEKENLGSLAQSARLKELNTARWILIILGILMLGVNGFLYTTARESVRKEIQAEIAKMGPGVVVDQQKLRPLEEDAVVKTQLAFGSIAALGALFIVFGLLIKTFPVPITIISLTLYILANVVVAALSAEPAKAIGSGLIIKIFIIVALAKAVQAALAYQKELNEQSSYSPSYD